ncbi:hypothetical protein QYE76_035116 [Lolium multiflorum]|uniref:Uncharacterized protein n=1 Tax=Lolium multiflorum TaxID=4521 RepID=A0AAD8R2B1_LOLMU|nr:hypothetical protein QYE76_035116 [Lolium multiflorum]
MPWSGSLAPDLLGKIRCVWWWRRRGKDLRRSEMAALNLPSWISVNKPKVCSLSSFSILTLFVLLPLAGCGGEGWGRRTENGGTMEMSRGSLSLVSWCSTGGWPSSCDVKSPRWGVESRATPAKPPINKHCWMQRCALDILDIDLAGRGGEEEDEDGGDGGIFVGPFQRWEATFLSRSKATP